MHPQIKKERIMLSYWQEDLHGKFFYNGKTMIVEENQFICEVCA